MLEVRGLTRRFGGLVAVNDLTFEVKEGEILGLIGPNGSGKTTTFSMLSGALRPSSGSITFNGERVDGLKANRVCHHGARPHLPGGAALPRHHRHARTS